MAASHPRTEQQPLVLDGESAIAPASPPARSARIDVARHRYPFCLVWGPLPLITWICPWIGHLGICDSEGVVHDFAGPYTIGIDDFMTSTAKYYQFPREVWLGREREWDAGVANADLKYRQTMHNLVCNNCHHHSADALTNMRLAGTQNMSMMQAWWIITSKGVFVSTGARIATYAPFVLGLLLVLLLLFKVI